MTSGAVWRLQWPHMLQNAVPYPRGNKASFHRHVAAGLVNQLTWNRINYLSPNCNFVHREVVVLSVGASAAPDLTLHPVVYSARPQK